MRAVRMDVPQVALAMMQRTELYAAAGKLYSELMREEAERLLPLLHEGRVLDIGAGMAGYWIHVNDLRPRAFEVDILDFDRVDPLLRYGFRQQETQEAYNASDAVKLFLERNGAGGLLGQYFDAANSLEELGDQPLYQSIISLYSWGFHYPFSTYSNLAAKLLEPGGHLILDVRLSEVSGLEADRRFRILNSYSAPPTQCRRFLLTTDPSSIPGPPA